jgi:hypothetical protein
MNGIDAQLQDNGQKQGARMRMAFSATGAIEIVFRPLTENDSGQRPAENIALTMNKASYNFFP